MSIKAMVRVFESDIGRPEKLVLLAMADHANDEGASIYPSMARIAWKTSYTRRQVITLVQKMIDQGILEKYAFHNTRKTNVYRINWSNLPSLPPFVPYKAENGPSEISSLGRQPSEISSKPSEILTKPSEEISPNPSKNHKEPEGIPDTDSDTDTTWPHWPTVLEQLQLQRTETEYNLFLQPIRAHMNGDGVLLLACADDKAAEYIDQRLRSTIERTLRGLGHDVAVEVG